MPKGQYIRCRRNTTCRICGGYVEQLWQEVRICSRPECRKEYGKQRYNAYKEQYRLNGRARRANPEKRVMDSMTYRMTRIEINNIAYNINTVSSELERNILRALIAIREKKRIIKGGGYAR